MPISQTSTKAMLDKIEKVMEDLARQAATKVIEQSHYWRGNPPELQVSKSDLHTDITFEVKMLLVDLFMKGACMPPSERIGQ